MLASKLREIHFCSGVNKLPEIFIVNISHHHLTRRARVFISPIFWAENQHKKVSLRTTNKKVAIEMATKIAANLISGTFSAAPKPIGISDAAIDYVRTLEVNQRAKKTTVKYKGIFVVLQQ